MNQNHFCFNNNQNINNFNNPMLNQNYTQMNNPFLNQNNSCFLYNNIPNNNMNLFNQNQFLNNMNFDPNQMNQFLLINNMNQILMMQNMIMNQMDFMNSNMNQNNNNVQNNNDTQKNLNNSIDLKGLKKELIDDIIKFYQKNGKSYMNYGNPKQIEGLITHLTYNSSEISDFNEPLSYIEGPTVTMNFIYRVKKDYYVSKYKLPKSNSKFELYTIIMEKYIITNDFILVHKETILVRDDSNLESFSDNDNIIIIKGIYYPDDSYHNLLLKKTDPKRNIFLMVLTFIY